MAAAAGKSRYGQNAVYGSLAYDFNDPELYPGEEYGSRTGAAPRTQEQERVKVRTKAHAVPHTKQGLAPLALVGMFVAAFLFVIAVMAQVQLLDISATSVELQQQLDELEAEQAKLKIAYESAFNLTEIEEYATASLGMQKPRADQIYYIDTSSPDRAEVVAQTDTDSFVDKVADFISGIGAYFR